ncbi:MAG: hypothetical protein CV090_01595 [Nitrospira sp. WS238]|nr:hypothetical protein [Nitrospira sp. WS238]
MRFPTPTIFLLLSLWVGAASCVHKIHVTPLPDRPSSTGIPKSLQLITNTPSLEGADHRPGITLLKWSQSDHNQAILGYLQQRGIFASVSGEPGDLILHVTTKLFLTSRKGLYLYRIVLDGEMGDVEQPIKSYHIEQTAVGSSVRWVTESDRVPIETALRLVLKELTEKIETDRALYVKPTSESGQ